MVRERRNRSGIGAVVAAVIVCLAAAPALGAGTGKESTFWDLGPPIIALIIFAILLAVLGKWAWGPIVQQLKRREEDIADTIRRTEVDQTKAAELAESAERDVAEAKQQAQGILVETRKNALQVRDDLLRVAREEAEQTVDGARTEIEQARREAVQDMREDTARLAGQIAAQVLAEQLDADDQKRILADAMKAIGRSAAEEGA